MAQTPGTPVQCQNILDQLRTKLAELVVIHTQAKQFGLEVSYPVGLVVNGEYGVTILDPPTKVYGTMHTTSKY